MINKTLSHGVKIIKISTWLSAAVALVLVLIIGFLSLFPALLKSPIEQRLSEVSQTQITIGRLGFGLEGLGMVFNIRDTQIVDPQTQHRLASVDHVQFEVDWLTLFDDIYRPSDISIGQLDLYLNQATSTDKPASDLPVLKVDDHQQLLGFFHSLSVDKTRLHWPNRVLELGSVKLERDQDQLILKLSDQAIGAQHFSATSTLSMTQAGQTGILSMPMRLDGKQFALMANASLKTLNQDQHLVLEAYLPSIAATQAGDYLGAGLLDQKLSAWLQRAFQAGEIANLSLTLDKNLSQNTPMQLQLRADLVDMQLQFNSRWQALTALDAQLLIEDDQLLISIDNTQLANLDLQDFKVGIPNLSRPGLQVEVSGPLTAQSQQLTEFLKVAPLGETVDEVLAQFELTGQARGQVDLVIPLDQREAQIDVDLTLTDNRLSTLEGKVVVEDYNSSLSYHHHQILGQGSGHIRGQAYDILINPSNRHDDVDSRFAVELVRDDVELYITQREDRHWRARIESGSVKGNVEYLPNHDGYPTVRLLGFQVEEGQSKQQTWQFTPEDFPDMHLEVKSLFVDEVQLPDFSATLQSKDKLLSISHLQFDGVGVGQQQLDFNGVWVDGRTRLYSQASGDSLSEFLNTLKVKEPVKGGRFEADIRLSCECMPWQMGLSNLTGYVTLKVEKGEFSDQDPNLGRVLSLLNIDSISRRLKLDVDDLVSKGFVYDSINAKAHLGQAQAVIDTFVLDSTSSDIILTGSSNYLDRTYDLQAKVKPEIAASVPAATYLAGGGLAGLGVWLVDKALFKGKMIDKIVDTVVEFKYKISGDWDEPNIENISSIL